MLLTEDDLIVGAISGGCLESDVIERAKLLLLHGGEPIVVSYDTTATDDLVWGLGLGCNGAVDVLIESLAETSAKRQLEFIATCWHQHCAGAIATVFHVEGEVGTGVAARLLLKADGTVVNGIADRQLAERLLEDSYQGLANGQTQVKFYPLANGAAEVLIEVIQPPVSLLVFGAGYDAIPVVHLAKQLGWQVAVIDHRPAYATRDRFPLADTLICCHPADLQAHLTLNSRMAAVVMTHHYRQDQRLLQTLLPSPIRYLGILGPKRRTQQLLEDLRSQGLVPTESHLSRFYGPVGLDIGAATPEAIALAIIAEVQAVLTNRCGGFLRDRQEPIHGEALPCPMSV